MALDVYVGSLTRYYAGDWTSAGEGLGREREAGPGQHQGQRRGQRQERGRRGRPRIERVRDIERIRSAVLAWRTSLGSSLGERIGTTLDWDERDAAPHFSGR